MSEHLRSVVRSIGNNPVGWGQCVVGALRGGRFDRAWCVTWHYPDWVFDPLMAAHVCDTCGESWG